MSHSHILTISKESFGYDLQVELSFHDVSAMLLTEHAETIIQPYYQGNLNQAHKDPNRNRRTRASAKSRQNEVETGETKPNRSQRRVRDSSEAGA